MNRKKVINKKTIIMPVLVLACLFSASLLVLEYVSAASFNSDGKAGQRENECVASFEGIDGVDQSAIEELCGRYNDSDQWAYSYSTYLTAHRRDDKKLSKTDSSFDAIIQSVSNSSSQTRYADKTMTDKITSYTCTIEGHGTCYTDLVGKTTGELKLGQNQSSVSSGSNFKVTIPGLLQSGDYHVKITVTSNVLVNGSSTVDSFSTTELSDLNFTYENEPPEVPKEIKDSEPKEFEPDIYVPKGSVNFNFDMTQYLPVIMTCNPIVTIGGLNVETDAEKNSNNVYVLNKEVSNFEATLSTEASISFDGVQPEVIYGQKFLDQTHDGDVDYRQACNILSRAEESDKKQIKKTLENGELASINTSLKLEFDTGAETVMYARPLYIHCDSKTECEITLGALIPWEDDFYSSIVEDTTVSFFKNLWTAIKGIFTGGITCMEQLVLNPIADDDGKVNINNIFLNIGSYFMCYADTIASDGSTLTAAFNAFGNLGTIIKTVSSGITKTSIAALKKNNKINIGIPEDSTTISVFREAESTLSLEASMSIGVSRKEELKSTPVKLNRGSEISGESKVDKYITTQDYGKTITMTSKSKLSRLNYNDAGDKNVCKDGNGCDSPFHDIFPDYRINGTLIGDNSGGVRLEPALKLDLSKHYVADNKPPYESSHEEARKLIVSTSDQQGKTMSVGLGEIYTYEDVYTAPQYEEIRYAYSKDSDDQLNAAAKAVVRHPWNYSLSFDNDVIDKDDYNGIVIPGEKITIPSEIKNGKNNDPNQQGSGDNSPEIKLTLYYGALDQLPSSNSGRPGNDNNERIKQQMEPSKSRSVQISPIATGETRNGSINVSITEEDAGVAPGQYFCYYFGINYTNSVNDGMYNNENYYESGSDTAVIKAHHTNNQFTSRVFCKLVSMTPTIEVRGGSLYSNGNITLKFHQNGRLGSWVDYGIVSRANVDGLASGYGFPNNVAKGEYVSCADFPLSVNNDECSRSTFPTGNNKVVQTPSFVSRLDIFKQEKKDGDYQDIELSKTATDLTEYYYKYVKYDESETVDNSLIGNDHATIIYSKKDITIKQDIELSEFSLSTIPQVIIITDGDINIDEDVTRVDAWLIAKDGTIDTCSNRAAVSGELIEREVNSNIIYRGNMCNKKLEINGPVIAKDINLKRTYYKYESNKITDSTSEQFNIGDWVYFWTFAQSKNDAGYTKAYTRNLAPRY